MTGQLVMQRHVGHSSAACAQRHNSANHGEANRGCGCLKAGRVSLDSGRRLHSPLFDRNHVTLAVADVDLSRTRNFLFRILQHLLPLHQPAARGMANSTVNIPGLKPIAWEMIPE